MSAGIMSIPRYAPAAVPAYHIGTPDGTQYQGGPLSGSIGNTRGADQRRAQKSGGRMAAAFARDGPQATAAPPRGAGHPGKLPSGGAVGNCPGLLPGAFPTPPYGAQGAEGIEPTPAPPARVVPGAGGIVGGRAAKGGRRVHLKKRRRRLPITTAPKESHGPRPAQRRRRDYRAPSPFA